MLIESSVPLVVRFRSGKVHLKPGCPHQFSDIDGRKLLAKVPDKVREIKGIQAGEVVTWESPLFGLLSATALEVLPHGVNVFHPLTDRECVIPLTWLCGETR